MSKLSEEINEVMEARSFPLWMRVVILIFCQCAGLVLGAGILAFLGIVWNNSNKAANSDEKLAQWEGTQQARNHVLVSEMAKSQADFLVFSSVVDNLCYQVNLLHQQVGEENPAPITGGKSPEPTADDVKNIEARILDNQDKAVYRATHK